MFGYIRPLPAELKVKEYALYRSVYCGLCKTMKRYSGKTSTLALSYDFVFLALFRAALLGEPFSVSGKRCAVHPIKKRPVCSENQALRYCAGAAAILSYYKNLDDKNDSALFKKTAVKLLLPFSSRHAKKAQRKISEYDFLSLSSEVQNSLGALSELENRKSPSPDITADAFGKVLGTVFAFGIEDTMLFEQSLKLGYHIGRWIYFADISDDFSRDVKSSSYNPLIAAGFSEIPTELIRATMYREQENSEKILSAMQMKYEDIKNILLNTVTYGMTAVTDRILGSISNNSETPETAEHE